MIITWEEKDIKIGLIVGKAGRKERWMIGYGYYGENFTGAKFTLNSLSDGMVRSFKTIDAIIAFLNSSQEMPIAYLDNAIKIS
jgi:hypothetical protein